MIEAKFINGYEYDYMITNEGKVISFKHSKLKIMKLKTEKNGYKQIQLCKNGDRKWYYVHCLVYDHFGNGDLTDDLEIDHINGNKDDNRIENLRVCDRRKNCANTRRPKRNTSGEKNVYKQKNGYWQVQFQGTYPNGKRYTLFSQTFPEDQYEEACICSILKRQELHREFANHN